MMTVTDLELNMLLRVEDGEDPWADRPGGTRRDSQTLGRLQRKGLIERCRTREHAAACLYHLTMDGRVALAAERGPRGRLWKDGALWRT